METLAVFHILKNGGTTLVDRYKHNKGFAYQRVKNELVYNYQQSEQETIEVTDALIFTSPPNVVFGHGVTFNWDYLSTKPVKYATILREPCERMLSAYNYFKLEMHTIHNVNTTIDFRTWFINRSRLLPTPVFYQWQAFTDATTRCYVTEFGKQVDNEAMEEDYINAINNVNKLDHILFMENDYVKQFDTIVSAYGLTPNKDILHTHSTTNELNRIGQTYTTYEDLNSSDKQMLDKHLDDDYAFYQYCKEIEELK
jgi:hypothetical protein